MERCEFCGFPLSQGEKRFCTETCEQLQRIIEEEIVFQYHHYRKTQPEKRPSPK